MRKLPHINSLLQNRTLWIKVTVDNNLTNNNTHNSHTSKVMESKATKTLVGVETRVMVVNNLTDKAIKDMDTLKNLIFLEEDRHSRIDKVNIQAININNSSPPTDMANNNSNNKWVEIQLLGNESHLAIILAHILTNHL